MSYRSRGDQRLQNAVNTKSCGTDDDEEDFHIFSKDVTTQPRPSRKDFSDFEQLRGWNGES